MRCQAYVAIYAGSYEFVNAPRYETTAQCDREEGHSGYHSSEWKKGEEKRVVIW